AKTENAETFLATPTAAPAATTKPGKSSGTSAEDRAKNSADAIAAAERQLRDATRAQAFTAEERHAASLAALADDKAMADLAIAQRVKEGEITKEAGDRLTALNAQTHQAKIATVVAGRQRELDEAA